MKKERSFWGLIVTQFTGAFNDNLFKIIVSILFVKWINDPVIRNNWITFSSAVFVLPFLIFSLGAGRVADRWSKSYVIIATRLFEVGSIIIAIFGLISKNEWIILSGLFCLSLQSAFFAPAKYGILPELKEESRLSIANGILNGATFIAILTGTVVGTFFAEKIFIVIALLAGASILGLISSFFIDKVPAANPQQKLKWNPIPDFFKNWNLISSDNSLKLSMIALSYFWFLGALFQLNTLIYVKDILQQSSQVTGFILTFLVIGIALGSTIAGKMSQGKVELGLVPLGAFGISLFTLGLFFFKGSLIKIYFDVFLLGISCGFFAIPLETTIQLRSPKTQRGRILATSNLLSFIAILSASAFLWVSGSILKLNPAEIFLYVGLLSFLGTAIILWYLPAAGIRIVLYFFTNLIYRLKVIGRENIPVQGPALFVSNHVSFADPFLIAGSMSRQIRFLMFRDLYEKPWINPLVKLMEAIPVSENDSPKEIMTSLLTARKKLKEGHCVCIFSEGEISRLGGSLLGFKKGLEVILKDLDVPVIPVHLEGVWGSIFSFEQGKFIWKFPKKIPYPVTISFGKALKKVSSFKVRQEILNLGAEAFSLHRKKEPTLFSTFLKQAKTFSCQTIAVDSSEKQLTYFETLTAATLLGKILKSKLKIKSSKNIGILLPPSLGGMLCNVALASQGFVAINLNYTLSRTAIEEICKRADIECIISSQKMIEKLSWEKTESILLLESLMSFSSIEKIKTTTCLKIFPSWILEKTLFADATKNLDDLATVMFTSGSSGIPKGVMLSQGNILSNIRALTMLLDLGEKDAVLGVLPFFHSFGFTVTLWFPLLAGFKAAYHYNPLDSKTIGELCRKEKITFIIATPTFLNAYMRKIPKEDFASLRFAVVGAEKLRLDLASAFEQKYGVPLLEGYGCTELSPVAAVNVPNVVDGNIFQTGKKTHKVGRALPGVSVKVVDIETEKPLDPGIAGLLLIKGPNVMKGYLNDPEKTAEVMRDGWYVTGDIAKIDEDGFIEITDRLSRFSKIGGEMVPHLIIEQKLQEISKLSDRAFVVCSLPDDKKGESLVVLVAGYQGDLDQLWKDLNATNMPKLWIPARNNFVKVDAIPLLGSGKVDLQKSKEIIKEKLH